MFPTERNNSGGVLLSKTDHSRPARRMYGPTERYMNHSEAHWQAADPHSTGHMSGPRKPSRHARHSVPVFCRLFGSSTPLQEDTARARYGLATSPPIAYLGRRGCPKNGNRKDRHNHAKVRSSLMHGSPKTLRAETLKRN